jgi:GTPase SAR1 family protein
MLCDRLSEGQKKKTSLYKLVYFVLERESLIWRISIGRATEMDITMIGLQNAGKTSLLRVLAVSTPEPLPRPAHAQ